MADTQEYNGWPNHATWMVHLHITNTQWLMHTALGIAKEAPDFIEAADQLKEWVEEWIGDYIDTCQEKVPYGPEVPSFLIDLVRAQLDDVNWERIAQNLRGYE